MPRNLNNKLQNQIALNINTQLYPAFVSNITNYLYRKLMPLFMTDMDEKFDQKITKALKLRIFRDLIKMRVDKEEDVD